jgi:quinol monooxygenase YgiN
MIVISGSARVLESAIDRAVQAGSTMAATSRDEPGCIDYRFSIDIDDPLVVHLLEKWESDAALTAHFGTAHFAAFSETLLDVIDGSADFMRYEVSSAGPLFG